MPLDTVRYVCACFALGSMECMALKHGRKSHSRWISSSHILLFLQINQYEFQWIYVWAGRWENIKFKSAGKPYNNGKNWAFCLIGHQTEDFWVNS